MALYIDLLIQNNDLVLDPASVPRLTEDRHSIGQDIAHMTRETGLFKQLLAERSPLTRRYYLSQIELLMKQDRRLLPSSTQIIEEGRGRYLITATSLEFGEIEIPLQGVQIG